MNRKTRLFLWSLIKLVWATVILTDLSKLLLDGSKIHWLMWIAAALLFYLQVESLIGIQKSLKKKKPLNPLNKIHENSN
jgi:hypothetical protein